MKNLFIFIFSFCFFLNSFANINLAILDFNKIFKDSLQYKRIINSENFILYKKFLYLNNRINNLIKKKGNLKINYKKNKNLYTFLNNEKENILRLISKLELYINNKNINLHNLFLLRIQKIINYLIKKNKYDIIIDNNAVFYYNKNISDITGYLINKLS